VSTDAPDPEARRLLLLSLPALPAMSAEPAPPAVASEGIADGPIDLQRFSGRWYVIGGCPT
jgi:hypothetical protein